MAHDEKGVDLFRADLIALVEKGNSLAGNVGHIKLSGSKLMLDNGTSWEVVTSV